MHTRQISIYHHRATISDIFPKSMVLVDMMNHLMCGFADFKLMKIANLLVKGKNPPCLMSRLKM
jgi:hypothetical protein